MKKIFLNKVIVGLLTFTLVTTTVFASNSTQDKVYFKEVEMKESNQLVEGIAKPAFTPVALAAVVVVTFVVSPSEPDRPKKPKEIEPDGNISDTFSVNEFIDEIQ